ncbi:Hypothetical protein MexAM1_p1METAp0032 (plasmid) [Methylorubrum extorquens AM1]|uniref:Uncharacterized protein n=1 Tax=Methylorubrum extorquens (strain ATCC 14718 / DSM 1338 / JCM 2805 / NCIMB 9133 / AM1) TaxID=272630 RepID=C5B6Q5_METEA|nr:Hypothetical protein MexAM1_p1METAp0032 [Methylorubrum extorquens AM1]
MPMLKRILLVVVAAGTAFLLASLWPHASDTVRSALSAERMAAVGRTLSGRNEAVERAAQKPEPPAGSSEDAGLVRLTVAQITRAGIRTAAVEGGRLARHFHVPGTIVPSANSTTRIAVKTQGIAALERLLPGATHGAAGAERERTDRDRLILDLSRWSG